MSDYSYMVGDLFFNRVPTYSKEAQVVENIPQYPGDSLAEALFAIHDGLREKYNSDKRALQADIMWAAQDRLQSDARDKLGPLLGFEY